MDNVLPLWSTTEDGLDYGATLFESHEIQLESQIYQAWPDLLDIKIDFGQLITTQSGYITQSQQGFVSLWTIICPAGCPLMVKNFVDIEDLEFTLQQRVGVDCWKVANVCSVLRYLL